MFDGLNDRVTLGIAEPRGRYRRSRSRRRHTPWRPVRALVVAQDAAACESLSRALQPRFEVSCAQDPEAALTVARGGRFSLVLAVHRMTAMSGLELLEQLRLWEPGMYRVLWSQDTIAGMQGYLASGVVQRVVEGEPDPDELALLLEPKHH